MNKLDPNNAGDRSHAKKIIQKLGASGTPPERGAHLFTVGLDGYLKILEDEYLNETIATGSSAFKLVVGTYGGGKTHFFYNVRDVAWRRGYVVSYVILNATACPFSHLELVYKSIVGSLMHPLSEHDDPLAERGLEPIIRMWAANIRAQLGVNDASEAGRAKIQHYLSQQVKTESGSFASAIKAATLAAAYDEDQKFDDVLQWLRGEGYDAKRHTPYAIKEKIDKTNALKMIRSLSQWIRLAGYTGLVLQFDEGDRLISLSSAKDKIKTLDNLREIIDECGNSRIPGTMIFYAVPDAQALLDGTGPSYQALQQRLRQVFDQVNFTGVRISLDDDKLQIKPEEFLFEIGQKIASIYEVGYGVSFDKKVLERSLRALAGAAYSQRYSDIGYRRIFVSSSVEVLNHLKSAPTVALTDERAKQIVSGTVGSLRSETQREADEDEG